MNKEVADSQVFYTSATKLLKEWALPEKEIVEKHLDLRKVARQNMKACRSKIPMPSPNSIDTLFEAAQKAGEEAFSTEEFKKANDLIQRVSDAIADAEEFTNLYDEMKGWLLTGAQKILTNGEDTMKKGKDLATEGKFTEAIEKLKTIRDDNSLAHFVDYNKALKEFWAAASGMGKNEDPLSSLVKKDGEFTKAKQKNS